MNETFGKEYKLCSQKLIKELFDNGNKSFAFPFAYHFKLVELTSNAPFQVTISVPKRKFKHAHDRNRIKRLIREAIRKNKLILEEPLKINNQQLALFLIYSHDAEVDLNTLMLKINTLFNKLNESIYVAKN
jgi:ribonuclease P protein component